MDSRLALLVAAHGGAFSLDEARQALVGDAELAAWVRRGVVTRVRRAAFVETGRYREAAVDERYRLRVRAILASRSAVDVATHHAALALRRLPLWSVDLRRIDVMSDVAARTSHGGLVVWPLDGSTVEVVDGVRTVSTATALIQVAASSGVHSGVVAADAALHAGRCTVAQLHDELRDRSPRRGRRRAAALLDCVDARCESVGETRLRLVMVGGGLPVRSQVRILEGDEVVARVDFLVGERVIVEFDGAVKYAGDESGLALFDEKRREDRLRELGFEVVRVTWADLDRPALVLARIRGALVRAATRAS